MPTRRGLRPLWPGAVLLAWMLGAPGSAPARAGSPPPSPPGEEAAAAALEERDAASPAVEPHKNTLKWTTASEQENLGYDVYRSDREDGPFARITEKPVPGAGTTDETNRYEYVDTTIDPRKAYYYYVEAISFDGKRVRFTPIIRAAPKLPAGEDAGEAAEGERPDRG